MLSVNQTSPATNTENYTDDRFISELADGLRSIIKLIKHMKKRSPKLNPIKSLGIYPHFNVSRDTYAMEFVYGCINKDFVAQYPIFLDLQGVDERNAVSRLLTAADNQVAPAPTRFTRIASIIYRPFAMVAAGFVSLVNLWNLIPVTKLRAILPMAIRVLPLPIKLLTLVGSVVYFAPRMHTKLKNDLLTLFNEVLNDYNNNNYDIVNDKLDRIPRLQWMFLWSGLPGTKELKWSYYYLRYSDDDALELAETDEQKFAVLYRLINYKDRALLIYEHEEEELRDGMDRCGGGVLGEERYGREIELNQTNQQICIDMLAAYCAQLPACPALHHYYAVEINQKLNDCLKNIVSSDPEKFKLGLEQFEKIKLNGYIKNFCPNATVLYYQIYIIVAIFNGRYIPFDGRRSQNLYKHEQGWFFAREHMELTLKYIAQHLPEQYDRYAYFVDKMKSEFLRLLEAQVSKPPATLTFTRKSNATASDMPVDNDLEEEELLEGDKSPFRKLSFE